MQGWWIVWAAALTVGCTNSYDDFSFVDDAGTSSGGTGGAAGGATGGASGAGGAAGAAGGAGGSTGGAGGSTGGAGGSTGGAGGSTGGAGGSPGGAGGSTGGAGGSTGGAGGAAGGGAGGTGGSAGGGGSPTGSVACGSATCSLPNELCCVNQGGSTCIPDGTNCQGTDVFCDGPEDCPGTQVCCGQIGTGTSYANLMCRNASQCTFQDQRIVVCGGDPSVCPNGTNCQASQFLPQYNVCVP